MIKIFLVVIFMVDGEPVLIDGWFPRESPDMKTCVERAKKVEEYLKIEDNPRNPGYPFKVVCTAVKDGQPV